MGGRPETGWWRDGVIYQIYLRSFADGNGDRIGDLAGIRSRLGYLAWLGVDALWINPFYPSPMIDGGYDVTDYRDVDPVFGDLDEPEALLADGHALGLRVIIDLVPNHTSSRHPWFSDALAEKPGARERYVFREGRGPRGPRRVREHPAVLAGPRGRRRPRRRRARPGEDEGLPDAGQAGQRGLVGVGELPYFDQDGVHEIYREWRKILDSYPGERIGVAEAWAPNAERLARYLRPDELHQASTSPTSNRVGTPSSSGARSTSPWT